MSGQCDTKSPSAACWSRYKILISSSTMTAPMLPCFPPCLNRLNFQNCKWAHCKYSCQIPGGSPKSSPESRWDGVSPRLYLDRSSMGANTEESHPTKRCSSALKQEWFSDQPGVWLCYSPSSNTGQRSLQMHNRATHASMPQVVKASLKGDCLYLIRMGIRTVYKESCGHHINSLLVQREEGN